jgi:hypothetical protein
MKGIAEATRIASFLCDGIPQVLIPLTMLC